MDHTGERLDVDTSSLRMVKTPEGLAHNFICPFTPALLTVGSFVFGGYFKILERECRESVPRRVFVLDPGDSATTFNIHYPPQTAPMIRAL